VRLSFPLLILILFISCGDDPQPVSPIDQTIDPETPVGSGNNDVLVWSDEFEGTGSIDTSKWTPETGGGGWGNQEEQIYTSSFGSPFRSVN
jgi:hypothetical protein